MEKSKAELLKIARIILAHKKVKPGDTILLDTKIRGMHDRFIVVRGEPDNLELWAKVHHLIPNGLDRLLFSRRVGQISMADFARHMGQQRENFFPRFRVFRWRLSEDLRQKVLAKEVTDDSIDLQINNCTLPPVTLTDRRMLRILAAVLTRILTGENVVYEEEEGKDQVSESPETAGGSEGPAAAPQDGH